MKKTKWVKIGERAYLPFSFSFNGSQNSMKYLKRYGDFKNQDKALMYQNRFCWPENEIDLIANYQINQYKKQGAKYLWSMAEKCESEGHKFIKKIKELVTKKITNRSDITDNLSEVIEEYRKFVVFMTLPWVLEKFFGEQLHMILSKRNLKERVEIEKKLNQPIKQNEGEFEQISLLKIVSMMKKEDDFNPSVLNKVKKHIEEYSWLPMRWLMGEPMQEKDVIARLKSAFMDNFKEKLEELEGQPNEIKKESEEIMEQLKLNPEEKQLVLLLKEYVFIRTFRSDMINKAFLLIISRLEQAAKELGLSYNEVLLLSYGEIIDCLKSPEELRKIKVEERKKSWLLYRDAENIKVYSGKEAEKFAEEQGLSEETHEDVQEVHGNTGYKGLISGRVKIVNNPNEISKVEKGDILVAVMTFPSYIVAMERAAAFVTDEGGVLCHAAIVAREMKKPCVIATRNSTKVFRDGDLVEVDADNGVVRKINN